MTLNLEGVEGTGNSPAWRGYYLQVNSDSLFAGSGCCLLVRTGFLPMILSVEPGKHCHPFALEIGVVVAAKSGLRAFGLVSVRTAARHTASAVD